MTSSLGAAFYSKSFIQSGFAAAFDVAVGCDVDVAGFFGVVTVVVRGGFVVGVGADDEEKSDIQSTGVLRYGCCTGVGVVVGGAIDALLLMRSRSNSARDRGSGNAGANAARQRAAVA